MPGAVPIGQQYWQQSGGTALILDDPRRERADTGAMTETESLIAEVRQLRADVARLHAAHTAVHMRHGWMGMLLKTYPPAGTPSTRSTCGARSTG